MIEQAYSRSYAIAVFWLTGGCPLLISSVNNERASTMTEVKYVTRRTGTALANESGIPLKLSRVNKDASLGVGPKPIAHYGPTELYTPEEFMRYALGRAVPVADKGERS